MAGPTQALSMKSSEFQPRTEYVLIKPIPLESEKVTDGGIVIPAKNDSVNDRPTSGEVLSVGCDILDIQDGDVVIWPGTDGLDLEFTDGVFILLRYKSIIGTQKL